MNSFMITLARLRSAAKGADPRQQWGEILEAASGVPRFRLHGLLQDTALPEFGPDTTDTDVLGMLDARSGPLLDAVRDDPFVDEAKVAESLRSVRAELASRIAGEPTVPPAPRRAASGTARPYAPSEPAPDPPASVQPQQAARPARRGKDGSGRAGWVVAAIMFVVVLFTIGSSLDLSSGSEDAEDTAATATPSPKRTTGAPPLDEPSIVAVEPPDVGEVSGKGRVPLDTTPTHGTSAVVDDGRPGSLSPASAGKRVRAFAADAKAVMTKGVRRAGGHLRFTGPVINAEIHGEESYLCQGDDDQHRNWLYEARATAGPKTADAAMRWLWEFWRGQGLGAEFQAPGSRSDEGEVRLYVESSAGSDQQRLNYYLTVRPHDDKLVMTFNGPCV